jgi:hypothetical protein
VSRGDGRLSNLTAPSNAGRDYGPLAGLVSRADRTIDPHVIAEQWDWMGQFYASLESGHTTASVALKRLVGCTAKNRFYRANRDLGRIFKTEFLLSYLSEPQLRARIRRGLLKVEQLHALAREVYYGRRVSLRAEVRCAINQRHKLEHLCRYITRPAIANEQLTLNRADQVVLTLKTPYRDGTTHVVMSPLEFMQRLAALVPRPRLHLIRLHGLLAPNAKRRSEIVPSAGRQAGNIPVPGLPGVPINATDTSDDPGDVPQHSAPARMSWARLLKRVFDIDIEHCPHCGSTLKITPPSRTLWPDPKPIPDSIRFSPLSRPSPLDPRSRETANGPEIWYLGPMNGPKIPRFWTETRVIDNSQVHQYYPFRRKRAFILRKDDAHGNSTAV